MNLGSKPMALQRFTAEAVREWDEKQLAREHEELLASLPSFQAGGERQAACVENLRTIGQELFRRIELAHATA